MSRVPAPGSHAQERKAAAMAWLVRLNCHEIVRFLRADDLFRSSDLRMYSVHGEDGSGSIELSEKIGKRTDLIGLDVNLNLADGHRLVVKYGAHQVRRKRRAFARAAHRLAVQRNRLASQTAA